MKDFVKKHQHQLLALLNTIVIFAYAFMISGLYYETNDDATLSNIANGAFGANTQDLIYINIWFSYAVKFLHKIMPSVNFIVVIQLILTFISIYAVINMILGKYGSVYGLVMSNILFIPFATELISKFQYVKTSTIIIVAGLLLIATNLSKINNKTVGGFALVITGCAIRFESFFAAGALSAFTLLLYFFKLDKKGKITAIKQMIVLFALVFSLEMVNNVYYKTNANWTEYTVYNEARTNLSDYKENYIPLYFNDVVARGFTENDVQLIYCGNYFDNTFFDADTIDRAAAAVGNKPVKDIIADYLHICINLFLNINEKFYKIGFILSLLLLLSCKRKNFIYLFGTMSMFALLLLYLMVVNRFMSRIEAMMVIALAVNMVMCYDHTTIKNIKTIYLPVISAVIIIALCMPVQLRYRKGKYNQYKKAAVSYETVVQQFSDNKDNLYLFDSSQTDYFAGYDVFNPRGEEFFSNICPTGSWYSNSMYTNDVLKHFGMESPLIDSVNRSDVFISNKNIDIKLKYVQEHFNENVYAVKVTNNKLCDYQFRLD